MRGATIVLLVLGAAGVGGCGQHAPQDPAPPPSGPSPAWTVHEGPLVASGGVAPGLGATADGGAVVAAQGAADGSVACTRGPTGRILVARAGLRGRLRREGALRGDLVDGPTPVAGGRAVVLVDEATSGDAACPVASRLVAHELGPDGRATLHVLIERTDAVGQAAMAPTPGGGLVVAWIDVEEETLFQAYAARRSAAGTWSAPVLVAHGDGVAPQGPAVDGVAVAVGDDGAAFVSYLRAGAAWLATLRPDGTIGRRRRLGPADEMGRTVVAAARGRVTVAWGSQDGGEEREHPYVVRAAVLDAGPDGGRRVRVLDRGGRREDPPGGLALAMDDAGGALVTWDQVDADGAPVTRYAEAAPDGPFGPARRLADGAGLLGQAVCPDGTAAVVLLDRRGLALRQRPPGARTFAVRVVPTAARAADDARVACTARGRLLLAWATPATPAAWRGRSTLAIATGS